MAQTATKNRTTQQSAPKEAPRGNLPAQAEAKQVPAIVQFRDYMHQRMTTLEDNLPPTITPKRFVGVVMTALQNKPKLLECTFQSLWNACVRAAQDGLLPDGREGAIAPYGENKDGKRVAEIATWMPMVEGYRKKVFEAGHVSSWVVEVVHEKDDFEYELGDNAYIKHRPYFGTENPGGVVGAYSIAKLKSGEIVREVMSAFKIQQVQAKSKAGNGPWKDAAFFPEMCKKVVARRHYKQLPHSESMDAMIARDDRDHGLIDDDTPRITPPASRSRQLSQREAFDAYAGGTTIDNETGEVDEGGGTTIDDDARAEFENDGAQSNDKAASGDGATGEGTPAANSAATQQQTNENTNAASTQGQPEARTEADASDATASASTQSEEQAGDEGEITDGADRPWPPGTLPTTDAEYERYLDTELAKFTDATKVAPWWNSPEQKTLRANCKVVRFKELQDKAIKRRTDLGNKPVR